MSAPRIVTMASVRKLKPNKHNTRTHSKKQIRQLVDADPLVLIAEATIRNQIFKTTINVTLAIRKALRRYLGIEAAVPFPKGKKRP